MQKLVKTGKFSKINKQLDVKFWVNRIKFGAVSYLLSCNIRLINLASVSKSHMTILFEMEFLNFLWLI